MRHLSYENILRFQKIYPQLKTYKNFIETGTYKGGTILPMSKHFKNLYTMEINPNAYIYCKQQAKLNNIKNIQFFLGDSSKLIKDIIPKLDGPAVYFLDAHITDNGSGFTGKGEKDVPLLEELRYINDLDKNEAVIIIDDMRLFGIKAGKETANADWSDIDLSSIMSCFDEGRVAQHFIDPSFQPSKQSKKPLENDRYIIILSSK